MTYSDRPNISWREWTPETGLRPESLASWTRAKQRWLRVVGGLVAALPAPQVISKDEHDGLKAKLTEIKQTLDDAETEITELKQTVERLKMLKDRVEVEEVLLPENDIERFEALRETAVVALTRVAPIVQEAIRCLWGTRTRAEHLTWASTPGTRALSPHVSAPRSVVWLAGAPRAERHLEGRGNLGVAARGCGLAPPGS